MTFLLTPFIGICQPDPPVIHCISVESNGNVTLTYTAPADTGSDFGGYFFSVANSPSGPFSLTDSLFVYGTLTHTITGVNANNNSLYFFMQTREGCCNLYSVPSDTVRSIRMIVTSLSNEAVKLTWNNIHTPKLPSTVSIFSVSKELTVGVYTPFKNTLDTTLQDTNIFCSKFINYRVSQGDLAGCQSVSSIDGELFRDTKGPARPQLDTVSIDHLTGEAHITWFADSSNDTQGYVIYQFNGISYDSIGAVYGINNLSFINTLTQSATLVETYSISAFDSCKNLGPLADNHSTMLLDLDFVKCSAIATLDWTPYQNMNGGLKRYEIFVRENGGAWIRDGFVPPNVTSYEKELTQQGVFYEFYISATGIPLQTASSNIKGIIADIYEQPEFLYIRSASVSGSSVNVNCHVDITGDVTSYRLYRSIYYSGPYTLVGTVPYTGNPAVNFTDAFAAADEQQVFYKLTATDSCGLEKVQSNIAATVFLTAEGGNDFISHLNWLDYKGWNSGTGHFNIFRVQNGLIASSPFISVIGDTLFFTEDVSAFPGGEENICYIVQAVEDSINTFGFLDSAYSNIACAPQSAAAFIPNAFTPGGKNPVFKPIVVFEDPTQYSLKIFNRWGKLVFETNNPDAGWNGNFNDSHAEQGIYIYQLVFKGYNKKEIRRTGTVALIR
jgi:gliding motility-associated-like protein